MATKYLAATAQGDYDTWNKWGAEATKWESINNVLDSDYIGSAALQKESFFWDVPAYIGAVASVKCYYRAIESGADATFKAFARQANVDGAEDGQQALDAAWTWYTSGALARPGGGSWDRADLLGDFELCLNKDSGAQTGIVSQWDALIDFTPLSGAWSSLLVSVLGSVLGTGLLLAQMPALISAFNRAARGRVIIHGHEAAELFKDLKANPHRAHCFLGKAA